MNWLSEKTVAVQNILCYTWLTEWFCVVKVMEKLALISAWKACRKNDTYIQYHAHNYYELVYYCSGAGDTDIGGEKHAFSDKDFAVIPPGVEHDESHRKDCIVICIGISPEETEFLPGFYRDKDSTILSVINSVLREATNQLYDYDDMIAAKLAELKIEIARLSHTPRSAPSKNFEFVINYITENYHEKMMLRDFARQLNISYDYFQHRFRQLTGASPQQFLISRRVEAAKELLHAGELNCTEIAYRCGFSNSAQFSMIFKKELGLSPLQYREKEKIKNLHMESGA